jgi:hypothetical protein
MRSVREFLFSRRPDLDSFLRPRRSQIIGECHILMRADTVGQTDRAAGLSEAVFTQDTDQWCDADTAADEQDW